MPAKKTPKELTEESVPLLKSCPYCNKSTAEVDEHTGFDAGQRDETSTNVYNVTCTTCYMSGPQYRDMTTAMRAWNALPRGRQ